MHAPHLHELRDTLGGHPAAAQRRDAVPIYQYNPAVH